MRAGLWRRSTAFAISYPTKYGPGPGPGENNIRRLLPAHRAAAQRCEKPIDVRDVRRDLLRPSVLLVGRAPHFHVRAPSAKERLLREHRRRDIGRLAFLED